MKTIKGREDHLVRNFVTHIALPVLVEQNVRWLLSQSNGHGGRNINAIKTLSLR